MNKRDRKRRRKERDRHRRAYNRHVQRFIKHVRAEATKAFYDRSLKPADMFETCLRAFVPPLEYAFVFVAFRLLFRNTWVDIRINRDILNNRARCGPKVSKNIPQE